MLTNKDKRYLIEDVLYNYENDINLIESGIFKAIKTSIPKLRNFLLRRGSTKPLVLSEPSMDSLRSSKKQISDEIKKLTGYSPHNFFDNPHFYPNDVLNRSDRGNEATRYFYERFKNNKYLIDLLNRYKEYELEIKRRYLKVFHNPLDDGDVVLSKKDYKDIMKKNLTKAAAGIGLSTAGTGGLYYGLTKGSKSSTPISINNNIKNYSNIGKYATAGLAGALGMFSTYELLKLVNKYLDNKYKKCGNNEICKAKVDKIRDSIKTRSSAFKFINVVGIGAIAAAAGYKFGDKAYNNIINKFNNKS